MNDEHDGGFRAGGCPVESNGELRVWLTRSGRLALVCDECDSTWFDRNGVSPENAQSPYPRGWAPPDRGTPGRRFVARLRAWGLIPTRGPGPFVFPDGDALDRPAAASEIRDGGWGDLVPAES